MRRLSVAALLMICALSLAQQIPPGVRYLKTTDQVNRKAVAKLQKLFSTQDPKTGVGMTARALLCGFGMWSDLKPIASSEAQHGKKATFVVPSPQGQQVFEGRGMVTPAQKLAFWKAFFHRYSGSKHPNIRKATPGELKYYWAWIAYDIEEPLYIVEISGKRLLFNFAVVNGDPNVFTVDRMGVIRE